MSNIAKGVLQMKKIFKIVVIILSILLILQLAIFLTARYGWKIFGFDMCERPNNLIIKTVYVTDEKIHIVGHTTNSSTAYVGHTYEIKDNVLYLGIKQNLLFGFNNRNGGYSFAIEDEFKNIESIQLVNKKEEKCIWSAENDKKYMEKINKVRLYETVSVYNNNAMNMQETNGLSEVASGNFLDQKIKEQMKNEDFVYADSELLNRIQHPTFSDELYFTKGGGYLGVAELENGEELYLDFDRHFEYYDIIGVFGHYDY